MDQQTIIIHGATGWLGHYLVPALRALHPDPSTLRVLALHRPSSPRQPNFSGEFTPPTSYSAPTVSKSVPPAAELLPLPGAGDLDSLPHGTLIHLARGETDADFEFNRALIDLQNRRGERMIYASSFNAIEAYAGRPEMFSPSGEPIPLSDSLTPRATHSYGLFKARMETELMRACSRPTIFRFAATHGWAPNREARTQVFLKKLAAGENVWVSRGVYQNRSFVGDLAEQISLLATHDVDGVFHLGTEDALEEPEFLRRLAEAFGYSRDRILEGDLSPTDAHMGVERFRRAYPRYECPTETRTLQLVAAQVELARFRADQPRAIQSALRP